MSSAQIALQRCLNSPYLNVDESKRALVKDELAAAEEFLSKARASFEAEDEATGLKQVWSTMFRSARALVYKAGYDVDQIQCLEVALLAHYPEMTEEDIAELHRAQELVGPPDAAVQRAQLFMEKVATLA